MTFKSLIGAMGLAFLGVASAQPADTWVNWQVINCPPDVPPQIDARNFVNSNSITIQFTNLTFNPELFETSDTLNYTNVGFMSAAAGWQFDTAPAISGLRRPANSIFNSGSIFAGSSTLLQSLFQQAGTVIFGFNFFGGAKLIGSADTIVNTGTMQAGVDGLISLQGGTLSLSRGEINLEGTGSGIFDGYWGASTNVMSPAVNFNDLSVFTPSHTVTQLVDHIYQTLDQTLFFTNFTTWVDHSFTSPTDEVVRIVILNQQNPAISNNVYFPSALGGGLLFGDIEMEWIAYATNPVTGDIITNYISLTDSYLNPPTTNNFTTTNHLFSGNLDTQIPTNFFIAFGGPVFGTNRASPSPIDGIFAFDLTQRVTNQYGAYEAQILPYTELTNDIAGRSITNLSGRVELFASRVLDLNRTRAMNPNVIMLRATNHFAGNDRAQLSSAFWDVDLGTTNSSVIISNLFMPLPRVSGFIDFYRARWTNQVATGISTNQRVYHVLVVDSELNTVATPEINDFLIRKTNNTDVVISDEIDVVRNFKINAQNLTITSNNIPDPPTYPIAFYPFGGIDFLNSDTLWSTALPNLQNLTNHGFILVGNAAFFGGQRVSPFISSGPGDWYNSFISDGYVSAQGLTIYAKYFIDTGTTFTNSGIPVTTGILDAGQGPLSIYAFTAEITNGILFATNSSVSVSSGVLGVSNSLIVAGGPLTLSVTNLLDDGSLTNCVSAVSNKPVWTCQGFDLPYLPTYASLFATTVTNTTLAYHQVVNVWAGRDVGNTTDGFINNAAVGRLVLDGGHPDSLFTFAPASGNNALYVDDIEFMDYATNVDANGNYIGIDIQPGMRIYYAEAKSWSGSNAVSIAEKLNGANNGRFVWVSNYNCGFFSSTNTSPLGVPYVDPVTGTPYTVNNGVAVSTHIDSDNDSIVNFFDSTPFGTNIPTCACPALVVPAFLVGDNSSFTPGDNSSTTNISIDAPSVQYPGSVAPPDAAPYQSFSDVTGSYYGLFADSNVLSAANSGSFTASTTSKGKISGKLVIGSHSYSFSKQIQADGTVSASISRMPLHALQVDLKVNLAGGNEITGTVSDSHWISQVVAHRQVFDKKLNPANQFAGSYTMRIPGDSANGHPAGDGFATVKIDTSGGVQISGALADGTKITQKSVISAAGYWPMYVSAYQGAGCAEGWLQLVNQRIAGDVFWLKPGGMSGASAKSYSGGFTNHAGAVGMSYVATKSTKQPVSWNWGQIVLSGGGLSGFWTNTFYLDVPGHNFVPENSTLKLAFTPSSGLFQGSVVNPDNNQQIKFQGVLFQNVNVGLGYFLDSGLSGQLYLGPTP